MTGDITSSGSGWRLRTAELDELEIQVGNAGGSFEGGHYFGCWWWVWIIRG